MPLGGSRPKALLAALLLHRNEPVTTEQLIEMLWPDGGPAQPAKTIHVHVSRLRRALAEPHAPSLLETHTGSYVLRVGPGELDVDRFAELVADGRSALAAGDAATSSALLTEALGLWRGKALADFTYEAFAQAEIGHLEELRLSAAELAVEADLALGRHASAVPRLERLTAEHPLRERLHGLMMLALYRCGRQADALAAYRRLRQTLDTELGLEPGPELRRLEQRILRQEPDLEGVVPRPGTPSPPEPAERRVPLPDPVVQASARPLAGREAELSAIVELAAGLAGSRRLVLVSGDAGIGKTRLLAEAAARLHADGWPVLYGRADDESPVPYQAFVEALRHHLAHRPRLALPTGGRLPSAAAPLAALLPELEALLPDERPPTWEDPETGRFRLYVAFATVLSQVAAEERLVLVLDDLHWADAPALRLVRELVTRRGSAELIVLAAYREGEVDPDSPLAPPQPLAGLVADLRREQRLTRIRLGGLGEDEIAELASTRRGDVAPAVVRALHAATRGNPFLIEHVLPELADAGGDDRGVASALETIRLPDAITEIVGRRLQTVPRGVAETLAAAAVLGDEFRLEQLEAIVAPELRPVLPALETALRCRLLEAREEVDRFAFPHELLRRTLYAALSKSRAARLHLLAARTLEQAGAGPAELARHLWAARDIGGANDAAACFVALAGAHATAHEHGDAVAHYRKALQALKRAPPPHDASLHCQALLGLAASMEHLNIAKARAVYRRAATVAKQGGEAVALGRAAVGFARFQQYATVDREAVALLESAEATLPQAPSAVRAQVLCMLGVRLEPTREQDRRERLWRQAAEMARAAGDDAALTAILRYAPYVQWRPESLDERIAAADETVRRAEGAGLADEALWGQVNVVVEQLEHGDVARADSALAAARRLAEGAHHGWFEWHLPMLLATRALLAGDLRAGEQLALSSLQLRTLHEPGATETFAAQSAMRARLSGRADDDVVTRVEEQAACLPDRPVWRALLVDMLLIAGRDDEARDALAPLLDIVAGDRLPPDIDRLAVLALTAEAAARLGARDHADALGETLAAFAGRFVLIDRAWATWGAMSRVLGVVAGARGDVATATRHFESAVREHTAAGAKAWLAHTLADHAHVLIAAGDRHGGEQLANPARALARAHGLEGLVARLDAMRFPSGVARPTGSAGAPAAPPAPR